MLEYKMMKKLLFFSSKRYSYLRSIRCKSMNDYFSLYWLNKISNKNTDIASNLGSIVCA